nr:nucleotidyltransferase domain-containing protein [Hyphomonas sp. Mor2]
MTASAFTFAPDIPADKEAVIQSRLSDIERDHDVRFLFAIESGSRAWGFPSPDSDFDVRFVYAHNPSWYLSITPGRDVIELPLEDDWDINGWDIQKAIGLLLKPNPVLLEWLSSPIHYRWDERACQTLRIFADDHVRPIDCLSHYFHLARNTWTRNIERESRVNLKKYFYVLRPILAIRWVRAHPDQLPPMNFQELINGTEIDAALQTQIADLLEAKARASEVGAGARISAIDSLILDELAWASENLPNKHSLEQSTRDAADRLFRTLIGYKEL